MQLPAFGDAASPHAPVKTTRPRLSELAACQNVSEILREPPHRAALVFCWAYFRLYLLNLIWAVPILPFVEDWTWVQLLKITGACAGVGFSIGLVASSVYQVASSTGWLRTPTAIVLAAPVGAVPILCAIEDGPEMLGLAFRYHLITAWFAAIILYCVMSLVYGGVRRIARKP